MLARQCLCGVTEGEPLVTFEATVSLDAIFTEIPTLLLKQVPLLFESNKALV